MIAKIYNRVFGTHTESDSRGNTARIVQTSTPQMLTARRKVGIIAGNGNLPLQFARQARASGCEVYATCFQDETNPELEKLVEEFSWIKVGQFGKLISFFASRGVKEVAMVGGVNRVRLFGNAGLDTRGVLLIARVRSTKDDAIMRGVAEELEKDGIEVISCTTFLTECLAPETVLTKRKPTAEQLEDIAAGIEAIKAMSAQHIGQTVAVREGVIVAVEAVEGTDAAIARGGQLGGKGTVIVKFAKITQDMRFDVPTVGLKTIKSMVAVGAEVLALEAGRCLILDKAEVIAEAERAGIVIVGCAPLNT